MGRGVRSIIGVLSIVTVLVSSSGAASAALYRWEQGQGVAAFRDTFRQAITELQPAMAPDEKGLTIQREYRTETDGWAFEQYLEQLVLNAEDLEIEGSNGRLQVNMRFSQDQQQFTFADTTEPAMGEAYAVELSRNVRFAVFYSEDVVYANDLTGLNVLVNLPFLPDELNLQQFTFNITTQQAAMRATAVYDVIELVARASVRLRHFEGVDWFIPILDSLPGFFRSARFNVSPR